MSETTKRRAAVTGGRGRMAPPLAEYLRGVGWEVEMFSREKDSGFRGIDELRTAAGMGRYDVVLHLGWSSVPLVSEEDPGIEERGDFPLLQAMVAAANASKTSPLIVFFSTAAVYGNTGMEPVREDARCQPVGNYARAKLLAEEIVMQAPRACVLRITNVFGSSGWGTRPQGIIPRIMEVARTGGELTVWGDGRAVKDYVSDEDLNAAVAAVAERGVTGIYNLGSGSSLSINTLIGIVEEELGCSVRRIHLPHYAWDVERSFVSSQALQDATGWTPKREPMEAIREMVRQGL